MCIRDRDEPLRSYGPEDVVRLYSDEGIIANAVTVGAAKAMGIPVLSGLFDAFSGMTDVVLIKELDFQIPFMADPDRVVIVGMTRYKHQYTDGLGRVHISDAGADQQWESDHNEALNLLQAGIPDQVNWRLKNDTSGLGNYLRTLLLGGHQRHVGLKNDSAEPLADVSNTGNTFVVDNDLAMYVKGVEIVNTPYDNKAVL